MQLTTAMEDVMSTLGWAVVLPVCEQPKNDLPIDTRLHRPLVSLRDIHVKEEPPLHTCLKEHLQAHTARGNKKKTTNTSCGPAQPGAYIDPVPGARL